MQRNFSRPSNSWVTDQNIILQVSIENSRMAWSAEFWVIFEFLRQFSSKYCINLQKRLIINLKKLIIWESTQNMLNLCLGWSFPLTRGVRGHRQKRGKTVWNCVKMPKIGWNLKKKNWNFGTRKFSKMRK